MKRWTLRLVFALLALGIWRADATLPQVRLETVKGVFVIELFEDKPETTANFIRYIEEGRYAQSFAHRLVPGFVLQSGAVNLGYDGQNYFVDPVETYDVIPNEYDVGLERSNLFGTIAMARVAGRVDSATSQWFINLADNLYLDTVDEGFTVFGRVVGGIENLNLFNTDFSEAAGGGPGVYNANNELGAGPAGPIFAELPLLANSLTIENLIYTDLALLPVPEVSTSALLCVALLIGSLIWRIRHSRTPRS